MEATYHVDHATACYVLSSSHKPGVRIGSIRQLDGAHATSLVLVPQLIRQLCRLGTDSVSQQRFHEGPIRVRVGRLGHERAVQGDVDLTPQRMQPVVHAHDCLCTNAIVDLSFLERPSLASSLYYSDCRLRGRLFYTLT